MKIYKSINNKNIFTEDDINMPDQNSIINDIILMIWYRSTYII